jgi:hypothetical protein
MKRKWFLLAVSLAAVLVPGAAIYAQESSDGIPAGLVGTWTGNSGAKFVINADGNGVSTPGGGIPDTPTAYSATESALVLTVPGIGTTSFSYVISNDDSLTLTAVSGPFSDDIAAKSPFAKQQAGAPPPP